MYDALKARGKKRKTERNKKRSRSSHSIPHCRKPTKATDVESTPSKINWSVYNYLKTREKLKKKKQTKKRTRSSHSIRHAENG